MPKPKVTGTKPQPTTRRKPSTSPLPPAPRVLPGRFRMWKRGGGGMKDPKWHLRCTLGEARPIPTRGYGGWSQTSRDGRRGVTTFTGSETPAYTIELMLERQVISDTSVETKMRVLERLAGWAVADDDPPPTVAWIANVDHDYSHTPRTRWVVESLEWGDSQGVDESEVLDWIKATIVVGLRRDATIKVKAAKGFERAKLPKGRDLRQFARTHLDDPKRWREIADLNRDNPRCPQTATASAKRDVLLLLPPLEDD